jgi:hypothetical protein
MSARAVAAPRAGSRTRAHVGRPAPRARVRASEPEVAPRPAGRAKP